MGICYSCSLEAERILCPHFISMIIWLLFPYKLTNLASYCLHVMYVTYVKIINQYTSTFGISPTMVKSCRSKAYYWFYSVLTAGTILMHACKIITWLWANIIILGNKNQYTVVKIIEIWTWNKRIIRVNWKTLPNI